MSLDKGPWEVTLGGKSGKTFELRRPKIFIYINIYPVYYMISYITYYIMSFHVKIQGRHKRAF